MRVAFLDLHLGVRHFRVFRPGKVLLCLVFALSAVREVFP